VAVGAVVLDGHHQVLLVRRGRPPRVGAWTLPGGHVEPGETLQEAIVREVHEETGISARVVRELGVVAVEAEGFSYEVHEHAMVPEGSQPPPRPADDVADARWFSLDDLRGLDLGPAVHEVIERGQLALGYGATAT
jgi:8-oxo-dGTP diphosphatase